MHIGVIPDGNRRYMAKRGISNLKESYLAGIKKFYDFLDWCMELEIKEVTIYALSIENIQNRSKREISTLLGLFSNQALSILDDERIHTKRINIRVCGDEGYLSNNGGSIGKKVVENLKRLQDSTREYDDLILNLAIAYGGRQEIINAVRSVINNNMELNEDNIGKNLWIKDYPELVIRTSESRLSNFLTWQSAYSEIYFVPKLWQEFERDDLVKIVDNYNCRERRFGR